MLPIYRTIDHWLRTGRREANCGCKQKALTCVYGEISQLILVKFNQKTFYVVFNEKEIRSTLGTSNYVSSVKLWRYRVSKVDTLCPEKTQDVKA